jgi:hypothetical protein
VRWPPLAANLHVCSSHGHPFSLAHCSVARWPPEAADSHVHAFHGHPFCNNLFRASRRYGQYIILQTNPCTLHDGDGKDAVCRWPYSTDDPTAAPSPISQPAPLFITGFTAYGIPGTSIDNLNSLTQCASTCARIPSCAAAWTGAVESTDQNFNYFCKLLQRPVVVASPFTDGTPILAQDQTYWWALKQLGVGKGVDHLHDDIICRRLSNVLVSLYLSS